MPTNRYGNFQLRKGDNDNLRKWGGVVVTLADSPLGASHVKRLQEDLQKLGFTIAGKPDGEFDLETEWALREFQDHAKGDFVAEEDVLSTDWDYVDRLTQVANSNPYPAGSPLSGQLNNATADRLVHWLTFGWRCPVIVSGFRMSGGNRQEPFRGQALKLVGNPTGGSFTLEFDGETTASIPVAWTSEADVIQVTTSIREALEQLPNFAPGDIQVVKLGRLPIPPKTIQDWKRDWEIRFRPQYGGLFIPPQLIGDGSSLLNGTSHDIEITNLPRASELQGYAILITGSATGGHFTVAFDGGTAQQVNFSLDDGIMKANIESALAATVLTPDDFRVHKAADTSISRWEVRFTARYLQDRALLLPALVVTNHLTGTNANVTVRLRQETQRGLWRHDDLLSSAPRMFVRDFSKRFESTAVQQITLYGAPTGGDFTLTFGGSTTAALAYNATDADVQAALTNLTSIGAGNASVSGPSGGPWRVVFGGTFRGQAVALLTGAYTLTGGTSPAGEIVASLDGRSWNDWTVIGDFAFFGSRFNGPRSIHPNHVLPLAELTPEHLIGQSYLRLTDAQSTTYRVVRAVSEVECLGFFDSVNAYDGAFLSAGPCHWTIGVIRSGGVGEGELCGYLSYLRHADQDACAQLLESGGVTIDENWQATFADPPDGRRLLQSTRKYTGWFSLQEEDGTFRRRAPAREPFQPLQTYEAEGNLFKTWHWFYRFVAAGRTNDSYRRRMWHMARIRIRDILNTSWPSNTVPRIPLPAGGDRPAVIGDVYSSETAIGFLLQWHIYRPGDVVNNCKQRPANVALGVEWQNGIKT